jgi:N-acetylmuramoyl-L-alanine amidase
MRTIHQIVVHCSFTKPREGQNPRIGAKQIRKWHMEERRWRDIGYHYVIKRDGTIELGRPISEAGAHAKGHNEFSVGICLVGGMDKKTGKAVNDYTDKQWAQLEILIKGLRDKLSKEQTVVPIVCGHNSLTTTKTCPNFDVEEWWFNAA